MWNLVIGMVICFGVGCGTITDGTDGIDNEDGEKDDCAIRLIYVDQWAVPSSPGTYFRDDWAVIHNRSDDEVIRTDLALIWDARSTDDSITATFDTPVVATGLQVGPQTSVGMFPDELAVPEEVVNDLGRFIPAHLLSFRLDYPGAPWPPRLVTIELTVIMGDWVLQPQIRLQPTNDYEVEKLTALDLRSTCASLERWAP